MFLEEEYDILRYKLYRRFRTEPLNAKSAIWTEIFADVIGLRLMMVQRLFFFDFAFCN